MVKKQKEDEKSRLRMTQKKSVFTTSKAKRVVMVIFLVALLLLVLDSLTLLFSSFGFLNFIVFNLYQKSENYFFKIRMSEFLLLEHENELILGYDFNQDRNKILYLTGEPYKRSHQWLDSINIYVWDGQTETSKFVRTINRTAPYYESMIMSSGKDVFYVMAPREVLKIDNNEIVREIPLVSSGSFTQDYLPPSEGERNEMFNYCQSVSENAIKIQNLGDVHEEGGEKKFYGYYLVQSSDGSTIALSSSVCDRRLVLDENVQEDVFLLENSSFMTQDKNDKGDFYRKFRTWDLQENLEIKTHQFGSFCYDECVWYKEVRFHNKNIIKTQNVYVPRSKYLTDSQGNLIWLCDGKLYRIPAEK